MSRAVETLRGIWSSGIAEGNGLSPSVLVVSAVQLVKSLEASKMVTRLDWPVTLHPNWFATTPKLIKDQGERLKFIRANVSGTSRRKSVKSENRHLQSCLAQAIGYAAIKAGFVALYCSVFDLVRDLQADESPAQAKRTLNRFLKPDLRKR